MFSEVKNVNVESLKIGSKLLDFWSSRGRDEAACRREEESKRGRDGGKDESCHLLLSFPVLRLLRSIRSLRSLRSLQTLRTIRSIRVLNSIREIRVPKQNVWFVFRFVYSFANARCVGF